MMADMMIKMWGERNGRLLTPYTTQVWGKEKCIAVGHIVEMQDNDGGPMQYLECTGRQLDILEQPSFQNVTREIYQWQQDQLRADYENSVADFLVAQYQWENDYDTTIGDFLMGTGRM
jgi:hypothetical protein